MQKLFLFLSLWEVDAVPRWSGKRRRATLCLWSFSWMNLKHQENCGNRVCSWWWGEKHPFLFSFIRFSLCVILKPTVFPLHVYHRCFTSIKDQPSEVKTKCEVSSVVQPVRVEEDFTVFVAPWWSNGPLPGFPRPLVFTPVGVYSCLQTNKHQRGRKKDEFEEEEL